MPGRSVPDDAFFELPVGLLCIVGYDGRFRRVSRGWTGVLGYSPEELVTRPYDEFIHPEDLESSARAFEAVTAGTGPVVFENRLRARDGRYHSLQWQHVLVPEERLIYAMAWDVSEIRGREVLIGLRESNALLENLIQSSPLAIVSLDRHGRVRTWNPAAQRIFGLTAEAAVGQAFEDVLHGASRTMQQLKEKLTKREPFANFQAFI